MHAWGKSRVRNSINERWNEFITIFPPIYFVEEALYFFSKLNVVLNFQYTFVSISLSPIVSCATHIFPLKWKKMKEETVARMTD
jgi:hypothetical protein